MTKLSRETEALLERGRAGMPLAPAHRERLRGAILAKATGAAVVTSAGSAAAWTSLGTKLVGAAALVVVTGGAGVALGNRLPNRSLMSLATVAATSGGLDQATRATWGPSPQAPIAIANAMPAPAANPIGAPTTTLPWTSIPASTSIRPSTWVRPSTSIRVSTSVPASTAAPIGREISAPVAAATPTDVPAPVGLPASPLSTLAKDVRLLRDADLATKAGDPARALALLDEHAATFPRSDLEPERSAERVFALCRAGRTEDARSARGTFLDAHPTGPLAVRVKAACRGGPAE